ncbi:MAG: hypothetical protein ABI227_06240 [Rhodanobacter sp.]
MNHPVDDDILPFDDASHEREWLAQESAMRRERLHLDPAGDDARGRRYRLLARALREPLQDGLPADFAQRVAAHVAVAPTSTLRFEFVLITALVIALVIAAGIVTTIYGSQWLPSFSAILPAAQAPASRWLLALAGCLGVSWLLGQWQRPGHRHH